MAQHPIVSDKEIAEMSPEALAEHLREAQKQLGRHRCITDITTKRTLELPDDRWHPMFEVEIERRPKSARGNQPLYVKPDHLIDLLLDPSLQGDRREAREAEIRALQVRIRNATLIVKWGPHDVYPSTVIERLKDDGAEVFGRLHPEVLDAINDGMMNIILPHAQTPSSGTMAAVPGSDKKTRVRRNDRYSRWPFRQLQRAQYGWANFCDEDVIPVARGRSVYIGRTGARLPSGRNDFHTRFLGLALVRLPENGRGDIVLLSQDIIDTIFQGLLMLWMRLDELDKDQLVLASDNDDSESDDGDEGGSGQA